MDVSERHQISFPEQGPFWDSDLLQPVTLAKNVLWQPQGKRWPPDMFNFDFVCQQEVVCATNRPTAKNNSMK